MSETLVRLRIRKRVTSLAARADGVLSAHTQTTGRSERREMPEVTEKSEKKKSFQHTSVVLMFP